MSTELSSPVQYTLQLNDDPLLVNKLIGHQIKIVFAERINCVNCGRLTKKSFGQGFCYPCFIKSPQNSECIIHPEQCRAHLGEGRDPEWEKKNHLQPHIVYLAQTDAIKVGVTRSTQVPTRWIDQGAWKAAPIAAVPYRYLAGAIEVALKANFTDKTNWRNMLKNETNDELSLSSYQQTVQNVIPEEFKEYYTPDTAVTEIEYPVLEYPKKVKSVLLTKQPIIEGRLTGIRGQYWILGDGRVFNVRNHSGYFVQLSVA
ncbi:DUF2797 domain-containing protein [Tunicatimonas pelagia]|uniref:DUF2797 domain-containing protein n=1 Tax=Tunicatimonas pelagia TaxID=931531 RepID=UPI0026661DC9|nr:DUF2797 domain-containing protein [Tunicatimonas pelagia]WKN43771.1 DUF2797 domain-containing protein [Tunicatimonas pelagia]